MSIPVCLRTVTDIFESYLNIMGVSFHLRIGYFFNHVLLVSTRISTRKYPHNAGDFDLYFLEWILESSLVSKYRNQYHTCIRSSNRSVGPSQPAMCVSVYSGSELP